MRSLSIALVLLNKRPNNRIQVVSFSQKSVDLLICRMSVQNLLIQSHSSQSEPGTFVLTGSQHNLKGSHQKQEQSETKWHSWGCCRRRCKFKVFLSLASHSINCSDRDIYCVIKDCTRILYILSDKISSCCSYRQIAHRHNKKTALFARKSFGHIVLARFHYIFMYTFHTSSLATLSFIYLCACAAEMWIAGHFSVAHYSKLDDLFGSW